jgi:hypothetical protein
MMHVRHGPAVCKEARPPALTHFNLGPVMEFMLVCYNDEKHWDILPRSEQDRIVADCVAYAEDLKKTGHLRASGRLQPTATAKTIRGESGKSMILDGPFAETKEVLAGYYLVTCKDRAEAVAIAQRNPKLPFGGSIEVRPMIAD